MITVVVRVWMPDRPGALGQVASRIGAVRGDVLGIEILERGGGRAVDELTVLIPDDDLLDLLAAEIGAVDGVSVEEMRHVEADRTDPNLAALAIGAALAEAAPIERLAVFTSGVQQILDADWVTVIDHRPDGADPVSSIGSSPEIEWIRAFLDGSNPLDGVDDVSPSDLAWARLATSGLAVAGGRSRRPFHERERVRLALLARLTDALLA
jgi:hypothetical protein